MRHLFTIILLFFTLFANSKDNTRVIRDKQKIKACINNNIQYYKQNKNEIDPLNFFEPYSERKIELTIDSICYRKDSLIALIFIVIKKNRKDGFNYDGWALMGYRYSINQSFKLYPISEYGIIAMSSYKEAIQLIQYCIFYKIKDKKDRFGNKFVCGLSSKDFWQKSLFFKIIRNRYYFQTILGKPDEYIDLEYQNCD